MLLLLLVTFLHFASAQMGPPTGSPTLLNWDGMSSSHENIGSGIDRQWQLTVGAPVWKSEDVFVGATLNFQRVDLISAPFASVLDTRFENATVNFQGAIFPGAQDGWVLSASFGSASDKIFDNSDVFTYNFVVQRRNQTDEGRAFLYGFFYSNNAAILPGLPIPTLSYEIQNKESGDFIRIGFPLVVRKNELLPQTQWGLFSVGPIIWDTYLRNTSWQDYHFTVGVQKRPDTFLLSEPIPASPLSQLMIEQTAIYGMVEFKHWPLVTWGFRAAYNFTNRFRLRETGTTRDDFDQKQAIPDYGFLGITLKVHAPKP